MVRQNEQTEIAKQYLLGTLPEKEAAQLEDRYFVDDELFEEIEVEEDKLIDAYLLDQLSDSDREQFEDSMLYSERLQERVALGKLLLANASTQTAVRVNPDPTWWSKLRAFFATPVALQRAFAFSIVILSLGGAVLTLQWMRLRETSQQLAYERSLREQEKQQLNNQVTDAQANARQLSDELRNQQAAIDKLNQELENAKQQLAQRLEPPGTAAVKLLTLFAGSGRGVNDGNALEISSEKTIVKLNLILDTDEEYATYRVSIMSADGRTPISRSRVRAHGPNSQRSLTIEFPSSKLRPGDYAVNVRGRTPSGAYDPVADYRFRLVKK